MTDTTPSARQAEAPWRVGSHYGIHVYEGDRPVATFHRPEDAARAVAALSAHGQGAAPFWRNGKRTSDNGCCSSVEPCSHQRQTPNTLCETCALAAQVRPTAWMRGHRTPSSPHGPAEYDVDLVYGDDQPEGEGWLPLYAAPQSFSAHGQGAGAAVPGIYMASKAVHGPRWRKLRDAGWPIISTWIDEAEAGRTADWADLWDRCAGEPARAVVTVLYAEPGEYLKGALAEVGAALSHGRKVIVVGPLDHTWTNHRNVEIVLDLDHALIRARWHIEQAAAPRPEPAPARDGAPAALGGDDVDRERAAWKHMLADHASALAMIREAVEAFGPATSLESREASLLRGPEALHEAEGIVEALIRLRVLQAPSADVAGLIDEHARAFAAWHAWDSPANRLALDVVRSELDATLARRADGAAAGVAGDPSRWRHVKRGTTYRMLGKAEVQVTEPYRIHEEDIVVVYQSEADGKIWVRPEGEFEDGRFARIEAADRLANGADGREG